MARLLDFPETVNEVAARLVAAGAVTMALTYLLTRSPVVLGVLAYGFVARVASGPRFSPLARLASGVVAARIAAPRPVPGPPKRFAQGIGATLTVSALALHLSGAASAAAFLVGALVVAASLEAVLGFCLGCRLFALLMRWGLVPDEVCAACADLRLRDRPVAA